MSSSPHSLWSPLRLPNFRGLWTGSAIYFTGNAMQVMAASWLMVELTGSSFLVALVQTAVFFPMFLLALPAGVLADNMDRRRLIPNALRVQVGVLVILSLLAVLAMLGGQEPRRSWCSPSPQAVARHCCRPLGARAWRTRCRARKCRRPSRRCP